MANAKSPDKVLTVQVHQENKNPRTFKVPLRWITQASVLAWLLMAISVLTSVFAAREYFSERSARPELVNDLENEIQELKIALEKKNEGVPAAIPPPAVAPALLPSLKNLLPANSPSSNQVIDAKASDQKAPAGAGDPLDFKEGVWSGLAENITPPPAPDTVPIRLEDARVDWQGKYANFTLNIVYKDPGKGSQQGHIVALGRANDRIFSHPEGVLNLSSGAALFNPDRGEYYSVARFRVLKARFGPFDSPKQLGEIQVFLFDLNKKLILMQVAKYGK